MHFFATLLFAILLGTPPKKFCNALELLVNFFFAFAVCVSFTVNSFCIAVFNALNEILQTAVDIATVL